MKFRNILAKIFIPRLFRYDSSLLMLLRRCRVPLLEFTRAVSTISGKLTPRLRAANLTWAQEGARKAPPMAVVVVELPTRAAEG